MSAHRSFVKRHEWVLVAGLAATSAVLGFAGFRAAPEYREHDTLDLVYLAVQLFPLQSGAVAPPVPWALEIARFLAPAVAAYAAVRALVEVLHEEVARFQLRRLSHHVIIAGAGRRGTHLAHAFLAQGDRVVVVDHSLVVSGAAACRAAGALVLEGDATLGVCLTEARAPHARLVIAACGEETTNAAVAVTMHELAASSRVESPLTCLVFLSDPYLCDLLREAELGGKRNENVRLEFVNIFDLAARRLLDRHARSVSAPKPGHVIVAGLGRLGRAVVLQSVRSWRTERGAADPLQITVVDRDAAATVNALVTAHTGLGEAGTFTSVELDALAAAAGRLPPSSVAYVCFDDDAVAFATALTLKRHQPGLTVVVRTTELAGLAAMLDEARLRPFDVVRETCQPSMLVGLNESLAMALHQDYVRSRSGDDRSPSSVPWYLVQEEYRESNRRRAHDLTAALGSIGCRLRLAATWRPDVWVFSPNDIDVLAEREHERWRREREQAGWRLGQGAKNDAARTNPLLVNWARLPESIKDDNRRSVAVLAKLLAREGFEITRRPDRHA